MKARPYQTNCLTSIDEGFKNHQSLLAVLATGLGKTVIFSHLAATWPGRVVVVAHREELIHQAREKIAGVSGEFVPIEMGPSMVDNGFLHRARVSVASVQTLSRPERLARFNPAEYGLLVIDEAHHAVASTYRRVIEHFTQNPACKVLGVTATPKRADELAMAQVFEHCCFEYGIEPAIDDGWLVPVRQHAVKVEGLDFSTVKSLAGDLSEKELDEILSREEHLHAVAKPTVDLTGDQPTLIFCVTVNHAALLQEVINRYKPRSAKHLSGETDKAVRKNVVEAFKAGEVQYLLNCGLFLEGFDAPNTAAVVMARPTKSLPLYVQVLGRGTRPLPGVIDPFAEADPGARRAAIAASAKPYMTVLDFVGNSGRHKIVTAADVLGGKWGEPVRARARELSQEATEDEGRPLPVEMALELADAELALIAEEAELERLRRVRADRAKYHAQQVSPFAGGPPAAGRTCSGGGVEMATEKQVWKLGTLGVSKETAEHYTKRQASAVIDKLLKEREARGACG